MRLILDELGIFKPVYQVELLLFHSSNFFFVQLLLLTFTVQLIFNHIARLVLFMNKQPLPFSMGISLLNFNHSLYISCPFFFLPPQQLKTLFVDILFFLSAESFVKRFLLGLHLICLYVLIYLFFHLVVQRGLELLIFKLLVLTLQFYLLVFHVSTTLHHDISCASTGLIDFANSLPTKKFNRV